MMNAPINREDFESSLEALEAREKISKLNEAHILRSKFLNAYSKIEVWAVKHCFQFNINENNLTSRLNKIRELQCKNQNKISILLDELKPITIFRGEFAHAVIDTQKIAKEYIITYQCPCFIGHHITENFGHLCPEKLKETTKRLHSIANSLSGLTNLSK